MVSERLRFSHGRALRRYGLVELLHTCDAPSNGAQWNEFHSSDDLIAYLEGGPDSWVRHTYVSDQRPFVRESVSWNPSVPSVRPVWLRNFFNQ
jgi:hypothetical protein